MVDSLKTICMDNLISAILRLPRLIREEITETYEKKIKENVEIKLSHIIPAIVEDVTDNLLSIREGKTDYIERPAYATSVNDNIYYACVEIAEKIVNDRMEPSLMVDNVISDSE